jgi:hypothetical protein
VSSPKLGDVAGKMQSPVTGHYTNLRGQCRGAAQPVLPRRALPDFPRSGSTGSAADSAILPMNAEGTLTACRIVSMVMKRSQSEVYLLATIAAVLTGCTSGNSGPAASPSRSAVHLGRLAVHIGLFGGPVRPGGGMADSNAPQPNAIVIATDDAGGMWSARTGQDGVATLSLPIGRYTVSSTSCGSPQRIAVLTGKRAYAQIACAIP